MEKLIQAKEMHMANRYLKAIGSRLNPFEQPLKADSESSTSYIGINELAEGVYVRSPFFGVGVVIVGAGSSYG